MSTIKRIILSGGGTGGHIYPATAIYKVLKEKYPDLECLYIGTDRGLESTLVPEMGIPFAGIEIQGIKRSLSLTNLKAAWLMLTSTRKAKRLIRQFQPDVVVGTGGYVCAPVLAAAADLHIPTLIHEQNSVAGLTNKYLSRKVDIIATSLEKAHSDFGRNAGKIRLTGNPRAQEVIQIQAEPDILAKQFGLEDSLPTVLIFGGSRGAPAINQAAFDGLGAWVNASFQVIVATGTDHYPAFMQQVEEKYGELPANIKVVPYIKNMPTVFQAISLVVCRSGATTLTELMALGLPSILIPSPYVTNNHQEANATTLVEKNAAVMIRQADLTGPGLVAQVTQLMQAPQVLTKMSQQAKKMAVTDAIDRIIDALEGLMPSS